MFSVLVRIGAWKQQIPQTQKSWERARFRRQARRKSPPSFIEDVDSWPTSSSLISYPDVISVQPEVLHLITEERMLSRPVMAASKSSQDGEMRGLKMCERLMNFLPQTVSCWGSPCFLSAYPMLCLHLSTSISNHYSSRCEAGATGIKD